MEFFLLQGLGGSETLIVGDALQVEIVNNELSVTVEEQAVLVETVEQIISIKIDEDEMGYNKFETVSLRLKKGDKETFIFNVTDSAGVAYDLTGETINCHIRANKDSADTLAEIEIEDVAPSDFEAGKLVLVLSSELTRSLPDLSVFDISADVAEQTLVSGVFSATGDVTR